MFRVCFDRIHWKNFNLNFEIADSTCDLPNRRNKRKREVEPEALNYVKHDGAPIWDYFLRSKESFYAKCIILNASYVMSIIQFAHRPLQQ